MLDTQWLQEDWVCTNLYSTVSTSYKISSWMKNFFKLEKCDLFVAFDFSISYTPNCTIPSYNFEKISGEGLTEPTPQTPPPLLLGLRPRFGLRPQISSASHPWLGLRPRIRPPRSQPGAVLGWAPLAFLSGCAPAAVCCYPLPNEPAKYHQYRNPKVCAWLHLPIEDSTTTYNNIISIWNFYY